MVAEKIVPGRKNCSWAQKLFLGAKKCRAFVLSNCSRPKFVPRRKSCWERVSRKAVGSSCSWILGRLWTPWSKGILVCASGESFCLTMQGLDTKQAPWFSLEIKPNDLPFLFKEDGESGWASTSAEFLASYTAMFAFGHLQGTVAGVKDCVQVSVCGGTDNKSTPEVQRKGLTTKWPLFGLQMCAHAEMNKVNKRLVLNWRPRDKNSNADALTNSDFSGFSPGLRVPLVLQQLPLGLMHRLTKVRQDFLEARSTLVSLQLREAKCTKREKQATKTAW